MNDTFTLTLTGKSSVLETDYFPPIQLSSKKNYSLALISFLSFNSLPNIDCDNNTISFLNGDEKIKIPTGSYEIDDLAAYLKGYYIKITYNKNTLRSYIKCDKDINFKKSKSPARLLGFAPKVLKANETHESDYPINILKVNTLRIECNITTGAYVNQQKVHTIYNFFPAVPPGYKIIEVPANPIYLPITVKTIDHLQLKIVDQNGKLVNFRDETITITLHVKS